MPDLVLASISPRREELMRLLDIPFEVSPSDFDESSVAMLPPEEHVVQAAAGKAEQVAAGICEGIVIGADTVVAIDDLILGKPADPREAREMLALLSGRSHYVYTGLCLIEREDGKTLRTLQGYERTEVIFGPLPNDLIETYVATGEPFDKAGAYGIQERGSVLVQGVVGDYFNVVGLPIYRLSRMLLQLGVPLWGSRRG
ncbi:MAG: Maf family protein [Armatimonadota bacterium]